MSESPEKLEKRIAALFADDRKNRTSNESRVNRIMLRVQKEIGMSNLTLLIFVRIWIAFMQLGAILYVNASKKRYQRGTNPAKVEDTGRSTLSKGRR